MNDPSARPPEYKVYRSRRKSLPGLRRGRDLDSLRGRLSRRRDRPPRERRGITPGRVVKWVALALAGWLTLSLVLFFVSAQLEGGVSDDAEAQLSGDGTLLTGSTVLVLGSDARTGESIDESQAGPARADTIMLLHAAFGSVRRLSIPRDTQASIPGHTTSKINAAYAIGGPSLMIETVEGFLGNGLKVDHLIEVDFADFPQLVDALGGVTVDVKRRICSPPFDNFWRGINFKRGKQELDGRRALGFARVRTNNCAPSETDLARVERQQQLFSALPRKVLSPEGFVRLPFASWRAPQALKTDLRGPGLLALFADLASGGSGDTVELEPSCLDCGVGASLVVSDGAKAAAVRELEGG